MGQPMTAKRLAELKTLNPPHPVWTDIFTVTDGGDPPTPEQQAALNKYLESFMVWPSNADGHHVCPGCAQSFGKAHESGIIRFLLEGAPGRTGLRGGIAHGEAHCVSCSYPFKQYHYDVAGLIQRLDMALPYHPSGLEMRRRVEGDE